jgi:hypothetical protein
MAPGMHALTTTSTTGCGFIYLGFTNGRVQRVRASRHAHPRCSTSGAEACGGNVSDIMMSGASARKDMLRGSSTNVDTWIGKTYH